MAYNYKIVIQQSTVTADDYGERDKTWTTYKTLWAERDDSGGFVGYTAEMPVYTDALSFRVHAHDAPAVTTKMRIYYDSKYYMIRSITRQGRLHFLLTTEAFDDE